MFPFLYKYINKNVCMSGRKKSWLVLILLLFVSTAETGWKCFVELKRGS